MSDRRLADTSVNFNPNKTNVRGGGLVVGLNYSLVVDGLNSNEVLAEIGPNENPLNSDGSLKEGYIKDEFDVEIQIGDNYETVAREKKILYYKVVKTLSEDSGYKLYRAIFSYGDSPCSYLDKKFDEIYINSNSTDVFSPNAWFYKREVSNDSEGNPKIIFTRKNPTGKFVRDETTNERDPFGRQLKTWVNFPDMNPRAFYGLIGNSVSFPVVYSEYRANKEETISCAPVLQRDVYPITVFISKIGLDTNRNNKLLCGGDRSDDSELSKYIKELTVYVDQNPQDDNFTLSEKLLYSEDGETPIPNSEFTLNTPNGLEQANAIKAYGVEDLYYIIRDVQETVGDNINIYKKVAQLPSGVCNRNITDGILPDPKLTGCRLVNSRSNPYNLSTTICGNSEYKWDPSISFWQIGRQVRF